MALDITPVKHGVVGDLRYCIATCNFDDDYAGDDGEAVTLNDLQLTTDILFIDFEDVQGYEFEFNHTSESIRVAAANVTVEGSATGTVNDNDNAATAGVQIYCVIDEQDFLPGFALGHFEFVSPTDTDGTCTTASGGPTLLIADNDDAATNGTGVRAVAAGGGLESTFADTQDPVLVPVSDGKYIRVVDATTGSTPLVYFDEDAANTFDRLQAVVVDNTDEAFSFSELGREGVVQAGTDLSALSVRIFALGN